MIKYVFPFEIFIIMEFKVGDLVWIASAFEGSLPHGNPALILNAYISQPKIFLNHPKSNRLWLEEEDIGEGWVYDILIDGTVDVAVLAEWLLPFSVNSLKNKKGSDNKT
tara:strand:+ start:2025 stop:2351 length:327 start_codon:yes stop_codon:yes gene_type:complete